MNCILTNKDCDVNKKIGHGFTAVSQMLQNTNDSKIHRLFLERAYEKNICEVDIPKIVRTCDYGNIKYFLEKLISVKFKFVIRENYTSSIDNISQNNNLSVFIKEEIKKLAEQLSP